MSTLSKLSDAIEESVEAIVCDECGENLDIVKIKADTYLDLTVRVSPCESCIKAAEERGRDDGEGK